MLTVATISCSLNFIGAVIAETRRCAKSSDLLAAADAGLDHDELVAAQSSGNIIDAGNRAQPLGDRLEQEITGVVPEGVIDLLEVVEVDEVHGEAPAPQAEDGKRILQRLDQLGAIGEAGQRVVMGEEADAPIHLLLFLGSAKPSDRGNADRGTDEEHRARVAKRNALRK